MSWDIILFETPRKERPVAKFILSLQLNTRTKVSHDINVLSEYGSKLPMPYSKLIGNKIYELRTRGKEEIRIFYTFHNSKIYLLHGFKKKTQKTPSKEVEIAVNRLKLLTN